MEFSRARLHQAVVRSADDATKVRAAFARAFAEVATRRIKLAAEAALDNYSIPLSTVSRSTEFDSYIHVTLRGAPDQPISLIVDTGNFSPILPSWTAISQLPNWGDAYTVLNEYDVEPWGAPAKLVKGPLELIASDGSVFAMEEVIFYACTGNIPGQDSPTANFGAGCLTKYYKPGQWELKPAQTYAPDYPYAEFDFAPAVNVLSLTKELRVETGSTLRISKSPPDESELFDIIPDLMWMALTPRSLSIGGVKTDWPDADKSPIAMIDTGGTCAYLSDPDALVYDKTWPNLAINPDWTSTSVNCQSTSDSITIELGGASKTFTYTVDTTALPKTVQGLTLVMCQKNDFMMDQYGMNIGGISALEIGILVDYRNNRVGLKSK
jgi:hypothetical protein